MNFRSIIDALSSGEKLILATVVRITGSSYGGVGTRMVIRVDGTTVGIVSGGCLESDLAEHASAVHETHTARIVAYDTRSDDEAAWGLGLGCNGLIEVLLEPLDPPESKAIADLLRNAIASPELSVLATVIRAEEGEGRPSIGAHALLRSDSSGAIETTGDWGNRAALDDAVAHYGNAVTAGRRGFASATKDAEVTFEVVHPTVRLVICGTGPDVVPLARLAAQLGWDLTVIDHRPPIDSHPERFPGARLVECVDAAQLGACVTLTDSTAAVVMSHHFARDTEYVDALLRSNAAYIGVLGPRARTERILLECSSRGDNMMDMSRLFSPVGMDIGGDGPDAIAVSIIAEISAVMGNRKGGHLRGRRGPLHGG